jgi:hypothetical protein
MLFVNRLLKIYLSSGKYILEYKVVEIAISCGVMRGYFIRRNTL